MWSDPFILKINRKQKQKTLNINIPINNKFTILKGRSATGKSTIVSWIANRVRLDSYLTIESPIDVRTLNGDLKEVTETLSRTHNILFIFDEESVLLKNNLCPKHTLAKLLKESDNLFLIITRDNISIDLALPEDSVFTLQDNVVKSHTIQNLETTLNRDEDFITVIEDSGSAYNFLKSYFPEISDAIYSSKGIANLFRTVDMLISKGYHKFNIIYDSLGSGVYLEKLFNYFHSLQGYSFNILPWYSFEYYLFNAKNLIEFRPNINRCDLNNKEHFLTSELEKRLHFYSKKADIQKDNCILKEFNCHSCEYYTNCSYSVKNRKDNYLNKPLVENNSKTKFFS